MKWTIKVNEEIFLLFLVETFLVSNFLCRQMNFLHWLIKGSEFYTWKDVEKNATPFYLPIIISFHPFIFYAFAYIGNIFLLQNWLFFHQNWEWKFFSFLYFYRLKFISWTVIFRVCVFVFDPSCVVFAFTFHCTQFFLFKKIFFISWRF